MFNSSEFGTSCSDCVKRDTSKCPYREIKNQLGCVRYYESKNPQKEKISRYDGFSPETQNESRKDVESSDSDKSLFDSMRGLYYGDDWLRLLFPSLFQY